MRTAESNECDIEITAEALVNREPGGGNHGLGTVSLGSDAPSKVIRERDQEAERKPH